MRAWLTFMVSAVVATAGLSVYLVQNPPTAGAAADAQAQDAAGGSADDLPQVQESAAPAPAAGLEDGIAPKDGDASQENGTSGEAWTPNGSRGDEPPFGTLPEGDDGGDAGGPDDGASTPEASRPPEKPKPWTKEWTRTFSDGPAVIPVDVAFGYAQLNLTVVFTPKGLAPAAVGSGEVQLTWTDAPVPKITCRAPVPLDGPTVCGPHKTPATEGAWEVSFVGSGEIEAKVTLTAWIQP